MVNLVGCSQPSSMFFSYRRQRWEIQRQTAGGLAEHLKATCSGVRGFDFSLSNYVWASENGSLCMQTAVCPKQFLQVNPWIKTKCLHFRCIWIVWFKIHPGGLQRLQNTCNVNIHNNGNRVELFLCILGFGNHSKFFYCTSVQLCFTYTNSCERTHLYIEPDGALTAMFTAAVPAKFWW